MRSAYELPPWLAAANTPLVKSTAGLGTGGGAGVETPDSGGFGAIQIQVGSNPSAGGNIVITFPGTPPTLFISGTDGLGTVTQGTVGNDVTLTWDGTPRLNSKQRISYEWANGNSAN